MKDCWDEGDPLGDILDFIERVTDRTGYPLEYKEEAGYFCRVCQQSVTAVFAIHRRVKDTWHIGPATCPVCCAEFPLVVREAMLERKEEG